MGSNTQKLLCVSLDVSRHQAPQIPVAPWFPPCQSPQFPPLFLPWELARHISLARDAFPLLILSSLNSNSARRAATGSHYSEQCSKSRASHFGDEERDVNNSAASVYAKGKPCAPLDTSNLFKLTLARSLGFGRYRIGLPVEQSSMPSLTCKKS